MTTKASRRAWRKLGGSLLPMLFVSMGILWILVDSYRSRSNQTEKYTLPSDHSAASMLDFLRQLDGEYDPRATMFKSSNLPAINVAVRSATGILEKDRSSLSLEELREADYYRLYYGLLAIVSGDRENDSELDDLVARTKSFISGSKEVSTRERDVAAYALLALDVSGRASEAVQTADFIEAKFSSLPDSPHKSTALAGISGIRNRMQMLGSTLDWSTRMLGGTPLSTRDLRGKVVLVEFWSTTCGPCIADFPALKRIYSTYHDQHFEVLAICLHASASRIESFTKAHELPWIQVCHDPIDGNDDWATQFGINAVPTTMLVDQSGQVVAFGVRPLHHDKKLDLEANLKRLLPKKPADAGR